MDIVRLGDSTDHGGTVMEAFGQTDLNGKPMAGVGHQVVCPLCKGTFPIIEGSTLLDVDGVPVALHGMKTACGASLIASEPLGAAES
ncbi:PAAR domain-containing protein [Pseudomonas aeruginosa]|uniref:PAAR domain-containing protein n=1 Tax=Pseudomonas aeruginosa TaxID=287 RepID=UPI000D750125|nr:PAAR domain-containing protein [Pseudomonas aeruginosa]MBG4277053.1 PAAR domain-containing protein [Pseudomonas aeruginosa]MBN7867999.1 PAAR domain-containing protein [Pseudomonas aeruginosa]QYE79441.1 PAAR domain-containing protein [Pseudomonas aeruginosa]HCF2589804.1 PAAR domain-containing protein [Pseudomonas aeruginosa]